MKIKVLSLFIVLLILFSCYPLFVPDKMPQLTDRAIITARVFVSENEDSSKFSTHNASNIKRVKDFIISNVPPKIAVISIDSLKADHLKINFTSEDEIFSYAGEIHIYLQENYAFLIGNYECKFDLIYPNYFSKFYALNSDVIKKHCEDKKIELHKFIDYLVQNIGSLARGL